jgi:hypothetical protein
VANQDSNSEVGGDVGAADAASDVTTPDAPAADSPVDAAAVEVGDALSLLDGEAGNCFQTIKNSGYAAGAASCSTCMENTLSRETECKAIVDCLVTAGGVSCTGNCYTGCINQGGGGSVTAACVSALMVAGGCQ